MTHEPETPTLKDIWRLLGTMNKRFDALERQAIDTREQLIKSNGELRNELHSEIGRLRAEMVNGFGALKSSIEARDFRLDEHGRRITELETLVRG
jgi:hypothetical protein